MESISKKQSELLEQFKNLLSAQIKIDVASEIREHPHLAGQDAQDAYAHMTQEKALNTMVRELAREEVEDTLAKGETPADAFLYLAGMVQTAPRAH